MRLLKKRYRNLPAGGLPLSGIRGLGPALSLPKGCPPNSEIPQDWGIQGVDVDYFSNLLDCTSVVTVTAEEVGGDKTDEIHQYGISQ